MSEQWTKPDFRDISVAGECTAYAGIAEQARPRVSVASEPHPSSVAEGVPGEAEYPAQVPAQ